MARRRSRRNSRRSDPLLRVFSLLTRVLVRPQSLLLVGAAVLLHTKSSLLAKLVTTILEYVPKGALHDWIQTYNSRIPPLLLFLGTATSAAPARDQGVLWILAIFYTYIENLTWQVALAYGLLAALFYSLRGLARFIPLILAAAYTSTTV